LLWRDPIFAPLPGAKLERLAAQLLPGSASPEETIIHEGDPGDRFYLIAQGQVEVTVRGHHVATVRPGSHVGEIALLRGLPRTATVTAE
jgi:CRP-like cAMP-binding protein